MSALPRARTEGSQVTGPVVSPELRVAGILWILLLAAGAIALEKPRRVVPSSASATEFSAERAMRQVREVARAPHPVGSAEHARVRDYLLAQLEALGLEPSVQKTVSILAAYGTAATVENIVALKRGQTAGPADSAGPAVLLAAHYDSVPAGPGAGDDGAGVATLLETARALAAGPPIRNDVIFLFTDGEELGLLGAAAFVTEHPWKDRVSVALNFDNRGTGGSVVMYETGRGNLSLMREFSATVLAPRASSLAGAISQRMPNSSDFFVFRKAGLAGLNFAFIAGPENYHTPQDTPARVDLPTLQQAGDYALPLARRLGELDLAALAGGGQESIYFNVGNRELVYPQGRAIPLGIAGVLLFAGVTVIGFARGAVHVRGMILALTLASVNILAAWRAADWLAMGLSRAAGNNPLIGASGPYLYHPLYAIALFCLVAGITFALWEVSGVLRQETALAGAGAWAVLGVVLAYGLPSASYLAFWPLVPVLAAQGIVFAWQTWPRAVKITLLWLSAVPAVVLLAPLVPLLHLALGLTTLGATALAILLVLTLWLLAPLVAPSEVGRPRLAFFFLAAGAACVLAGVCTVRYDAAHPRPEWMAYVLDCNHSEAHWMSRTDGQTSGSETRPDPWRRQYLGDQPGLASFPVAMGPRSGMSAWERPAPSVDLPAPEATLLEETQEKQLRILRIRLRSPRHASRLSIEAKSSLFDAVRLNGHLVGESVPGGSKNVRGSLHLAGARETWSLLFAAPPDEGLEATFVVPAGESFELTLGDISDGLPDVPGQKFMPRPPEVTQQHLADVTVVLKHFSF